MLAIVVFTQNYRPGIMMCCVRVGLIVLDRLQDVYYDTLHAKLGPPALVPGGRVICCETGDRFGVAYPPPIHPLQMINNGQTTQVREITIGGISGGGTWPRP